MHSRNDGTIIGDGALTDVMRNIIEECRRQEENCLHVSSALFVFLRSVRFYRWVFVLLPVVTSGVLCIDMLYIPPTVKTVMMFMDGTALALYKSLGLDMSVSSIANSANEFLNLKERFRQAVIIHSKEGEDAFILYFKDLMSKLEEARSRSIVPPERCLEKAKRRVSAGRCDFAASCDI